MGTPCSIAYMESVDDVESIYCNFDGYISHTGRTLFENYNSSAKARELIEGGNIRGVDARIEEVERYEGLDEVSENHTCIAEWVRSSECSIQYFYLWDGEQWHVHVKGNTDMLGNAKFEPLEGID